MYQRKTSDEYRVQGYYAQGWEEVTAEDNRKDAKERLRECRENEPGTAFRIIKGRIRLVNALTAARAARRAIP